MSLLTITSTIRGGGSGKAAWVARIMGLDDKFGLGRMFIKANRRLSGSGRSGRIDFELVEPGIYEVKGVQLDAGEASIGTLWSGFIRLDANGTSVPLNKADVIAALSEEPL